MTPRRRSSAIVRVSSKAVRAEIDGRVLSESTGHSGYLVDRSTSQHNQAVLVAGASEDRLVHDDGRGFGDWLSWTPGFMT